MLEKVKKRCYINSKVFDDEITSLIDACIKDLEDVGIKENLFSASKVDDQILNCVVNYVKAYRGNDRTDTEKYLEMYNSLKNKLSMQNDYVGDINE